MKGTYLLVIYLRKKSLINIGALGRLEFQAGYYFYVGSAMGNEGSNTLLNRVKRHVDSSSNKKIHWHIDYLLDCEYSYISKIFLIPSSERLECFLSSELKDSCDKYINNFGSSDCSCDSHLFYFSKLRDFL
ncbi:MAG: GIY-YIG nuclease family protein [Candidatus Lokiarchaeota archaeon]|nr:GIY-YIG nuclease family protein [Candidatus Lokiarchaeota archaeon]